ncbi:MAG: hypothetical protein FJ039_03715 [Chloroflexi bacterium]|nr:hypothetical protein [Chloroflexota bacterium]
MPLNSYHFEDHWFVPFPPDEVWRVLSRAEDFPLWWRGVYLTAKARNGEKEPRVGALVDVTARGFLPYKLRFTIESTALERPRLIQFKATGDFVTDASRWIVEPAPGGSRVTLDWNPRVEKGVVKYFSPLLRPLFRANHNWTMRRGQRQIVEFMTANAKKSGAKER